MSVQNGKVYQCVITIVLDDFVLLEYCVNNRTGSELDGVSAVFPY